MTTKQKGWVAYAGTPDQLKAMRHGFIFRDVHGEQSDSMRYINGSLKDHQIKRCMESLEAAEILIDKTLTEVTPEILADLFWNMASEDQAKLDKDTIYQTINIGTNWIPKNEGCRLIHVPEITWHNCAEQMPPDDRSVAVMVRLIGDEDIICSESKSVNRLNIDDGYEWALYTPEKWEALNK